MYIAYMDYICIYKYIRIKSEPLLFLSKDLWKAT